MSEKTCKVPDGKGGNEPDGAKKNSGSEGGKESDISTKTPHTIAVAMGKKYHIIYDNCQDGVKRALKNRREPW